MKKSKQKFRKGEEIKLLKAIHDFSGTNFIYGKIMSDRFRNFKIDIWNLGESLSVFGRNCYEVSLRSPDDYTHEALVKAQDEAVSKSSHYCGSFYSQFHLDRVLSKSRLDKWTR